MSENVEIYVLDKQVRLLQPADGFRTSLDSVMLAAACPAQGRQRVLDMGCGVGGAAFCVLHRVPDCHVTGVDVQDCHVDLAQQNIELNNAEGRAAFMAADIRDYDVDAPDERFDHVICNPPYLEAGEYTPSPKEKKAKALGHHSSRHSEGAPRTEESRHEKRDPSLSLRMTETMTLDDWVGAGFRLLKPRGSLTMIHRADATGRIVQALGRRFGGIEIIPLWPRAGQPAKRVIVRALKDRRSPSKIHPGLVLHRPDGNYTPETDAILRGIACLVSS